MIPWSNIQGLGGAFKLTFVVEEYFVNPTNIHVKIKKVNESIGCDNVVVLFSKKEKAKKILNVCISLFCGICELWTLKDFFQSLKVYKCNNSSLGLATKARACKGANQVWNPRVTFHAPRSVRECEGTLTFTSELPLWKLESRRSPKFLENNFRGQNPSDGRVLYIIGKFLELRCLKWSHMTHLET